MRYLIEITVIIAFAGVLAIGLSIGLEKEIRREQIQCLKRQAQGYAVECR